MKMRAWGAWWGVPVVAACGATFVVACGSFGGSDASGAGDDAGADGAVSLADAAFEDGRGADVSSPDGSPTSNSDGSVAFGAPCMLGKSPSLVYASTSSITTVDTNGTYIAWAVSANSSLALANLSDCTPATVATKAPPTTTRVGQSYFVWDDPQYNAAPLAAPTMPSVTYPLAFDDGAVIIGDTLYLADLADGAISTCTAPCSGTGGNGTSSAVSNLAMGPHLLATDGSLIYFFGAPRISGQYGLYAASTAASAPPPTIPIITGGQSASLLVATSDDVYWAIDGTLQGWDVQGRKALGPLNQPASALAADSNGLFVASGAVITRYAKDITNPAVVAKAPAPVIGMRAANGVLVWWTSSAIYEQTTTH